MNAHSFRGRVRRRNLLPVLVVLASSLVAAYGPAAGVAQTEQGADSASANGERVFEDALPRHVPVKVKLKSEKSFKDLKNKGWAREFALEVKNTGVKPIHYIYLIIHLDGFVLEDGVRWGFPVKHGRNWLAAAGATGPPEEPPIQPGESIIIKIPESTWKGYEAIRDENKKDDPKRVRVVMQIIDFGDGTGFESTQGERLTYTREKSALESAPAKEGGRACQPPPVSGREGPTDNFLKTASFAKPASLLRVYLLLPEPGPPAPPPPRDLCGCQNISNCFFGKITCPFQCPCDDPLPALGVARLHLDYRESKKMDEHGNRFRYRAKVDDAKGAKAGRWAWDVFLVNKP